MPAGRHPNSKANLRQWLPGESGNPTGQRMVRCANVLKELGFDPIREAVARYRDPKTPNSSKDFCLGLITDRLLPKLKAVEIRSDQATSTAMLINIIAGAQPVELTAENELLETITEDDDDDLATAELTDDILCDNVAAHHDDE